MVSLDASPSRESRALDIPPISEVETPKKEREKQIKVRYIGLITSVRKVQTKTGKLMAIAGCE